MVPEKKAEIIMCELITKQSIRMSVQLLMHVERLENCVPTLHSLVGRITIIVHDRRACQIDGAIMHEISEYHRLLSR